MTELELTVSRTIPAPREAVFDAWLDPSTMAEFMKPAADMASARVTNDPRVGGEYEVIMIAGDKEIPHRGTYQAIDPHDRIVFTWLSDWTTPDSTVTLTFTDDGEGTKVTLHHRGFPTEDSRDSHAGGWAEILEMCQSAVAEPLP